MQTDTRQVCGSIIARDTVTCRQTLDRSMLALLQEMLRHADTTLDRSVVALLQEILRHADRH
jgi:hypothetical protein